MFIRKERSMKEFLQLYPVISSLVIIHLALWLVISFLQLPIGETIYMWGVGSNFQIHQGEYWRLVTPIFLHADITHVLFNSFSLVLFGPALEQMLGKFKFVTVYLGAGVIGNLGTFLLGSGDIFHTHLGASGAIYGLFGMYIYMVFIRRDLIDQSSAQIIIIISVIGLIMTFIQSNINVLGHLFGFIGGLALAPIFLSNAQPYSPWQVQQRRTKDTGFDPNRWNKKRLPRQVKKKIIWGVLGVLIVLGLFNMIGIL